LAETGSRRIAEIRTNEWPGKVEIALGEAECAVTQTVHFKASVALEWWWVTSATAEQKVSSKHSNAIFFEIDCITAAPQVVLKIYTGKVTMTTRARNLIATEASPKVRSLW